MTERKVRYEGPVGEFGSKIIGEGDIEPEVNESIDVQNRKARSSRFRRRFLEKSREYVRTILGDTELGGLMGFMRRDHEEAESGDNQEYGVKTAKTEDMDREMAEKAMKDTDDFNRRERIAD